ncbi:MAG: phosphotransferase [Polyangiales bacterium]
MQRLWAGYGEICRVHLTGAQWPSVIVKQVRPPPASGVNAGRDHARKLHSYAVETAWYERYASRCDAFCRVALLVWCEPASAQPLLVLEDLDAAGFTARRAARDHRGKLACLDWLAQLHATFMGEPGAGLWTRGTYWHLATRPDELAVTRDHALRDAAAALDTRLRAARYHTLVHGDAKVENFCFAPDASAVAAVDFQYVGQGVGVQDVAYFLGSCLDDTGLETDAPALLDHYYNSLRSALATRQPALDAGALEAEWRALYPIAWADFCRFLSGWAPDSYPLGRYDQRMKQLALSTLATTAADSG